MYLPLSTRQVTKTTKRLIFQRYQKIFTVSEFTWYTYAWQPGAVNFKDNMQFLFMCNPPPPLKKEKKDDALFEQILHLLDNSTTQKILTVDTFY